MNMHTYAHLKRAIGINLHFTRDVSIDTRDVSTLKRDTSTHKRDVFA